MYINIVMLFIEEVSRMSKSGYSDMELLEYINKHYDEIECELNGGRVYNRRLGTQKVRSLFLHGL